MIKPDGSPSAPREQILLAFPLHPMASPAHCLYCFEVLSSSFNGREPPSLKAVEALYTQYAEAASKLVPTSAEAEADSKPGQQPADEDDQDDGADGEDVERRFPLFVTWNTLSRRGLKTLRGCIGTFEPLALEEGLRSYALTSYVPLPKNKKAQKRIVMIANYF